MNNMDDSKESKQPVHDAAVTPWLEHLADFLDRGIPTADRIWRMGQKYLAAGDAKGAHRCEQLNYFLHNSSIPNSAVLGEGVHFGYGGIGVIIHSAAEIGKHVTIGSHVTLGGKTNTKNRIGQNAKRLQVPRIGDYVYLATGSKILGGVEVGTLSIIGANAVVLEDVPPLSVVAGIPGKVVRRITVENCLSYKGSFPAFKDTSREDFIELIRQTAESVNNDL